MVWLRWVPRGEAMIPWLLVALLVLLFVVTPLADLGWLSRPLVGSAVAVVVMAGLLTLGGRGRFARPAMVAGAWFLLLQAAPLVYPAARLGLATDVMAAAFCALLCLVLLRDVFSRRRINMWLIAEALVVYLLIALLFAVLFEIVQALVPGGFHLGPDGTVPAPLPARLFYLSVITLTSVGFGDLAPVHPFARSLVMLEALIGQVYTTVVLGWLVSVSIQGRRGGSS